MLHVPLLPDTARAHGRSSASHQILFGQAVARAGAILLASLAVAACHRDPPPAAPTTPSAPASAATPAAPAAASTPGAPSTPPLPATPPGTYKAAEDGSQSFALGDVRIETSADLPQCPPNESVNVTGDNQLVVVLRGWSIVVHEGRVSVSGKDFGPAPAGSVIRLSKDGVRVGTELRGPLP